MKTSRLPVHRLELRVSELMQLFHSLDPTPFLHRDFDRSAEAYIDNWAREFPPDSRLQITIHLEHPPATVNPTVLMTKAVHNHFDYRASLMRAELRQLLRQGRTSLCIGLAFVAVCLLIADTITQAGGGDVHTIARESLTLVGWVAMWRPVEIFLYDWWPLVRRIRVYKNLRYARVRVVQAHDGP
jgi:hypothetical protein